MGGGDLRGLFPFVTGTAEKPAVVQNLRCEVAQTAVKDALGNPQTRGALSLHAQNAVLDGIEVVQTAAGGSLNTAAGIAHTVDTGAVARNCSVTLAAPQGGAVVEYYGGVCYYNRGLVENCRMATAGGKLYVNVFGGVVMDNYARVANCTGYFPPGSLTGIAYTAEQAAAGTMSGLIGGIVGVNYEGTVENSVSVFNFGAENPANNVGGIVGMLQQGLLSGCRTSGEAIEARYTAGGIAGSCSGPTGAVQEIVGCESAIASVNAATNSAGGIVGDIWCNGAVRIANCLTSGDVSGQFRVGGMIGAVRFAGDGTPEAPHAFTLTGSKCDGRLVAAAGPDMLTYAGGAIGILEGTYDNLVISVSDCDTYADVTAVGGNNGGFLGGFETKDSPDKAKNEYTFSRCNAYGSVRAFDGKSTPEHGDDAMCDTGGFLGYAPSTAANLKIGNCAAYGSVMGRTTANEILHHIGGFFGYNRAEDTLVENCAAYGDTDGGAGSGGFWGRSEGATIRDSEAYGSIRGEWVSGGFIGYARGTTVSGCVARGSCYKNPFSTWNSFNGMGGFAGGINEQSSFTDCEAYGSAEGNTMVGGFAGTFQGTTCTFTNCVSYGNAVNATYNVYDYVGGFLGHSNATSSIKFLDCVAYGNVQGNAGGGFVGRADGNTIDFEGCTSYGSVTANGGDCTYGGFLGWTYCSAVAARNCVSYGSLTGSDVTHVSSDAGGFFGPGGAVYTVSDCHSYAESIVARPSGSAGFCASMLAGSKFTNCSYTVTGANLSFFVPGFDGAGMTSDITTTQPVSPGSVARPSVGCAIANSEGNISISLSAFINLPANLSVTSLLLSTDGGKTYTDLVYNNQMLVAMTVNGAQVAPGGKIAVTNALTVSYLYDVADAYPVGDIQLLLVLSNGYSQRFLA